MRRSGGRGRGRGGEVKLREGVAYCLQRKVVVVGGGGGGWYGGDYQEGLDLILNIYQTLPSPFADFQRLVN